MTLNALRYSRFTKAKINGQITCQDALPVLGQDSVLSRVAVLFRWGSPTTVVLTIRAAVVYAFERMDGTRPAPHVSKKCLKAVYPLVANHDTTTTISLVGRVLGIQTTLFHACPAAILRCLMAAVGCVQQARIPKFSHQTTTTLCAPSDEGVTSDKGLLPAVTEALPRYPVMELCCTINDKQSSEPMSMQVNQFCHGVSLTLRNRLVNTFGFTVLAFQAMAARIADLEAKLTAIGA